MFRVVLAVGVLWPLCAVAAEETRHIGNWTVTLSPERFARSNAAAVNVVALREQDGQAFAVRCIRNKLTLALIDGDRSRYVKGEEVAVSVRADRGEIFNTYGTAFDGGGVEVLPRDGLVIALAPAREVAFRVTTSSGVVFDRVFSLRGTTGALAKIADECVVE